MIEKQQTESGEILVYTILFDDRFEITHDRMPMSKVPKLTPKEYFVRGSAALLDVVGRSIHHIDSVYKYARKEDVPEKALFVITTDGMENASRGHSYEAVRRMIARQQDKYG